MGDKRVRVGIVLVHGTWGRGIVPRAARASRPRWFERGSAFREQLLSELLGRGMEVASPDHVEWSGANAILDRDSAARDLAARLDALHAADPSATRLVIGHSHGGNVCLRAFAYLQQPADHIRIATLATPFVELLGGEADLRGKSLLIAWLAEVATLAWLFLQMREPGPASVILLPGFVVTAGLVIGLPLIVSRSLKRTAGIVEAASHAAFRSARPPTLVLRGVDDEASLTLGFGAISARLSQVVVAAAIAVASSALALLGPISAGVKLIDWVLGAERFGGHFADYVYFALRFVVLPGAVVVGVLAILEGIAPAVFGRELLLTYRDVQVNSNSSPDAGAHVGIVTLPPHAAAAGLRHALYAHPEAASRIAAWLDADVGGED